ncbi:hypothetical protein PENNAL_c0992G03373 [Penicillium nalgiovense]|nr:hypothetical protein PENNAL_c0992G03373 [Penicillium nalgiovense]
MRSTPLF